MWQETRTIFLESVADVLRAAARVLPSVFAMLLFFVITVVAAFLVRWFVRRLCQRLGLDRRLREWGVTAPSAPGRLSPSRLVALLAFWAVLVAGTLFALTIVNAPVLAAGAAQIEGYLPRALVALVILGIGLAGAKYVERSVLIGAVNVGFQSAGMAALAARWLILVFVAAVALEQVGVGSTVVMLAFGILFGGIVLALAIAIGLGTKDLVARSLGRRFEQEPPQEGERPTAVSGEDGMQHF